MPRPRRAPRRSSTAATRASGPPVVAALALIAAAITAYHGTFDAPFVFDDLPRIVRNPLLHHLWPPWRTMAETSRPLVHYTFAINYAISGLETWSYHVANLAIHVLAGLALLGVLRRTLSGPGASDRTRAEAPWIALIASAIWVVHPLQTEAVTYIVQRSESLASLFYLATLYFAIRAADATRPGAATTAAVACCALGMACKPVMATAPLAVLAYDRVFRFASFRQAWDRRRALYLGLFATLVLLPLTILNGAVDLRTSAGLNVPGVTALDYARTQLGVVLHYLRLAAWPAPLVFDYGWPLARGLVAVVVPGVVIAALIALVAMAARRERRLTYAGIWFFLVLAPSSSFVPIADLAVEHRMYLALAAPVVLATLLGVVMVRALERRSASERGVRRVAAAAAVIVVLALAIATIRRNQDYRTAEALWADTVAKRPSNPRAHVNLGLVQLGSGKIDAGLEQLTEALRLDPENSTAHLSLGFWLLNLGRTTEALEHLRQAARLDPENGEARFALGAALLRTEAYEPAYVELLEARRLEPERSATHHNLGFLLEQRGKTAEAITEYAEAVRLKPDDVGARVALGIALARAGRIDEGRRELEAARRLQPTDDRVASALAVLDRMSADGPAAP